MTTSPSSRQSGWMVVLGFWFLVGLGDFPPPFLDDIIFIGPAINLVRNHALSNPFCPQFAGIGAGDHFFLYMPLHAYVLAGWLKLAGISALSFHLFSTVVAFLVSLLIFRLFPAGKYAPLFALLVCLPVWGLLGGTGLRPDGLGLLFFTAGMDVYRSSRIGVFFWKNLFLGLTVITLPTLGFLALLLSAGAFFHQVFFRHRSPRELGAWALALGAAYAMCFGILLVCIQGLLFDFLSCLSRAQQLAAVGVGERIHFFTVLGLLKWVVLQAGLLILISVLICRWRKNPLRREDLFLLIQALLGFLILGYTSLHSATAVHIWAFGCLVMALFIVARENWGPRVLGVWLIFLACGALGHWHVVLENSVADKPPGPAQRQALLDEIARLNPRHLYVDSCAIRELYDYRPPPGALCFDLAYVKDSGVWINPHDQQTLPKESLSVVSVRVAFNTPLSPEAGNHAKQVRIFDHPIPGLLQNPYDLVLIDNRY